MSKLIIYIFIASLCATYAVASSELDDSFDGKMLAMETFLPQQVAMDNARNFEAELLQNMETFAPAIRMANQCYGIEKTSDAKYIIDSLKEQLKKHNLANISTKPLERILFCIKFNMRTTSKKPPHTIEWLSAIWNFYSKSLDIDHPSLLREIMEHLERQQGDLMQWHNGFVSQLMLVNAIWVCRIHHQKRIFFPSTRTPIPQETKGKMLQSVYQYEQDKHM